MVMGSYGWDPFTGTWGFGGANVAPTYGGGFASDVGGAIIPYDPVEIAGQLASRSVEEQYARAARAAMPRYESNPYESALLSRMRGPLMGQYAMALPSGFPELGQYGTESYAEAPSFRQWLMSGGQGAAGTPAGGPMFGRSARMRVAPEGWAEMIGAARDPGREATSDAAYERWRGTGPLAPDMDQVEDLISLATYDPYAGSVAGRMRGLGRERAEQRFYSENPFATKVDWLGYLTEAGRGLAAKEFVV
jgi:hypothetical protein